MTDRRKPVVVVGAGPVGLVLAAELSRRGLPVRIVDGARGPEDRAAAEHLLLLPPTLAILKPSGLIERLIAEGQTIGAVAIDRDGRRAGTLSLSHMCAAFPFALSIDRARAERVLIASLEGRGITVEWNTRLVELGETHRPTAILSTGEHVDSDAVVGCDGGDSTVRDILGLPWVETGPAIEYAMADVEMPAGANAEALTLSLRKSGAAQWLVETGQGRARLIAIANAHDEPAYDIDGLGSPLDVSYCSCTPRHAERLARGRIFFAGGAGHVHSPFGFDAIGCGIADAAWLAFLLKTGRASEYEMQRLPAIKRVQKRNRMLVSRITGPSSAIGVLLRLGLPMAGAVPAIGKPLLTRLIGTGEPQPEWLRDGA
ncbi:FAD-dependent monooxygenase [Fulvimarina endophytica]|uniref:FAD-dependent monooxygenase n=1 Tax=Fulvimarina endophytica TaxID=2293836 RepID=A0A371X9W8_9HYPH|nr:FAD-dependent monooxygenase [Fulvimarina endophytica]RFC66038.1 FAD-dependent monooxygenase [Fulvimarina endophytica]